MDRLTRHQIVMHYLKQYLSEKKSVKPTRSPFVYDFFTFAELHDIRIHFKYPPDRILTDIDILSFVLFCWNKDQQLEAEPRRAYVQDIIHQLGLYGHYLETKPIKRWDSTDYYNFNIMKIKSGYAKYAYAIFTSDVKRENIRHVTSKPLRWFTDLRLAESKKEEMVLLDKFKDDELVIHQDLRPL